MKTHQTSRVEVLVAGKALDASAIRHAPLEFQTELLAARAKFGNALCGCRPKQLPLVIRERNQKLFLAAWPDQANLHSLGCPFFSEPRLEDAATSAGAVLRGGDQNQVRLHHPLRQANRVLSKGATQAPKVPAQPNQPQQRFSKLHLWGLLHYLWDEAGLNRWHPGWHRDWGFVRHAIRRVAQGTVIDGKPLLQSLYVPPVWVQERKQETRSQWAQFIAPLQQQHRRSPLVASGFVIGAVRLLEPTAYGHALRLHHHAERFFMDDWITKALAQFSRRGWSAIKRLDVKVDGDERPHVIAALRVESSPSGKMIVVEAVLMRVSPRYIPVNSSFEDKLARVLVEQDRQFVRPLHYDNHSADLPEFVLKDAAPLRKPVAMYVYGTALDPLKQYQHEAADKQRAVAAGMDFWSWNAAGRPQPPPLPEPFDPISPPLNSSNSPTLNSSKE